MLAQQPAGAGTFDRWARSTGGHGSDRRRGRLPRVRRAPHRPRHIAQHPRPEANHGHPRATQRHETAQVGRVNPNHPAALRSGMQMGFDSPEQHILPTWSEHVERVQVRVAALAVRLGGFGTCAPGTWNSRASFTTPPGSRLSADSDDLRSITCPLGPNPATQGARSGPTRPSLHHHAHHPEHFTALQV